MATDAEIIAGIRGAGRYNATAASEDHARRLLEAAMPDGVEVPPAIAGQPYPNPPSGCLKWFQLHPAEPAVGHVRPHFKYADWTGGKKGRGGSWGHVEF
jgi:hypothetical protein